MTGIIEQMQAAIQQLNGRVTALESRAAAPVTVTAPPADPFAFGAPAAVAPPPPPPPPANVTADMITALIQPHVENDAIKAALGAQMREMGINALPETQPHQFTELYQRFQSVIAQFAGQAPATGTAPNSII